MLTTVQLTPLLKILSRLKFVARTRLAIRGQGRLQCLAVILPIDDAIQISIPTSKLTALGIWEPLLPARLCQLSAGKIKSNITMAYFPPPSNKRIVVPSNESLCSRTTYFKHMAGAIEVAHPRREPIHKRGCWDRQEILHRGDKYVRARFSPIAVLNAKSFSASCVRRRGVRRHLAAQAAVPCR